MFVLSTAKDEEATMDWDLITIPCPMEYSNQSLYFYGHLNCDQIVADHRLKSLNIRLLMRLIDELL